MSILVKEGTLVNRREQKKNPPKRVKKGTKENTLAV